MANQEVRAAQKALAKLGVKNALVTIFKSRKRHDCKECPAPIEPGEEYYCVYLGGAGLGNIKYPDRYHKRCLETNEGG